MTPDQPTLDGVDDGELRAVLSQAVREYSRRCQAARDDGRASPEALDLGVVNATDVVIAAGEMLRIAGVSTFELAMFAWTA